MHLSHDLGKCVKYMVEHTEVTTRYAKFTARYAEVTPQNLKVTSNHVNTVEKPLHEHLITSGL